MAYWLVKTEPEEFSWDDQVKRGAKGEPWSGVRNFTARRHMKEMKKGELAFFYHSNIGKEVVGICEVIALAHPDAKDETGTWECVDVKAVMPLPRPVTLAEVKANPKLANKRYEPPSNPCVLPKALLVVAAAKEVSHPDS